MTRYIQPLDVCINHPFKTALHHWDIDFRINNNKNTCKPNESDFIDAVVQIWYNEKGITSETIINSFKTTGISVNLEGSGQNLIKKNENLYDEIILTNDVILNNQDLNIIEKENYLFINQIN